MYLNYLELVNFRNYEDLNLKFNNKKILLIGKNAQGKTNILESLYYGSTLKSLRAKNDSELILWNKDFSRIKLNIQKDNIDHTLEIIINPPKKKILKVNQVKKTKSSDFCKYLSTVNFCVNDLLLLRGTPENRRNWLDLAISQIYPAYLERIAKYNKIKNQKNIYLKEIKNKGTKNELLEIWNTQLAISGSNIIYLRIKFLKELLKLAKTKHRQIAKDEELNYIYNSSVLDNVNIELDPESRIQDILDKFRKKLDEKLKEEIIRAQSIVGPHRDDLTFYLNNINSLKYASQGQQRTIVLSLKLSELDLIFYKTNEYPILLLDDVLAELDDNRQNFLLESIPENIQMIITSVDTLQFHKKYLNSVELHKIQNGKVI